MSKPVRHSFSEDRGFHNEPKIGTWTLALIIVTSIVALGIIGAPRIAKLYKLGIIEMPVYIHH